MQYISNNRNNHDLQIYEGINIERLYGAGMQPFTYNSYDDYIAKMSSPYTYMGQPEITAISALYGKTVHVHYNDSTLPPPAFATLEDIHLRYTQVSRHYDTYQPIIPRPDGQPHPPIQGVGYLQRRHDAPLCGSTRLACFCQSYIVVVSQSNGVAQPLILLRGTALVSSRVSIRNPFELSSAFIVLLYRMSLSCSISTRRLAPASSSKYWVLF